MNLYILKCKNGKYYVGTTKLDVTIRLAQHMKGRGAAWTKKHKPLLIEKELNNCDAYDEDKWTKIYMNKYGIKNVRGGSYSQMELPSESIKVLEREVNHANNKCLNCGKNGHYIKQCPTRMKPINKKYRAQNLYYLNASYDYESADEVEWDDDSDDEVEEQSWACSYCNKSFDTKKGAEFHENVHCKTRKQMKNDVSFSSDEDLDEGVYEVDGEHLYWDGEEWYEESTNYVGHIDGTFSNQDGDWRPIQKNKKSSKCYKCGRTGHYSSKCYAKKHVKGYYL